MVPLCRHELVEHYYWGNNPDVLAVSRSDRDSCGMRRSYADLVEDGRRAWVERVKREWGSGSYEE
jgi:hypothetical protein